MCFTVCLGINTVGSTVCLGVNTLDFTVRGSEYGVVFCVCEQVR